MKYKLRRRMSLGWLWLLLPWWGVSCVDSRYDLDKDIDMTINVGGEYLTFPVGSTDTTFLSKLISLGSNPVTISPRVTCETVTGFTFSQP